MMAVQVKHAVFWDVKARSFVKGFQCFRETGCPHLQDKMFLTTVSIHLTDYKASHLRRPQSET